jgi:hypothetical protein
VSGDSESGDREAAGIGFRVIAAQCPGMTECKIESPPPEQLLNVGEFQFHIGRAAVIALA